MLSQDVILWVFFFTVFQCEGEGDKDLFFVALEFALDWCDGDATQGFLEILQQ